MVRLLKTILDADYSFCSPAIRNTIDKYSQRWLDVYEHEHESSGQSGSISTGAGADFKDMLKRSIFFSREKNVVLDISWDYAVSYLCRILATEAEVNKIRYLALANELRKEHGNMRSAMFFAAFCLQEQPLGNDPEIAKCRERRNLKAKAFMAIHGNEAEKYYSTSHSVKTLFPNIPGYCKCIPRHAKFEGALCPSFN